MPRKFSFFALFALALTLLTLTGNVPTAHATVTRLIVKKTADAPDANPGDGKCASTIGGCTLRAAIMEANASGGGSVYLKANAQYTLTGALQISSNVVVYGENSQFTTINGNGAVTHDRVFSVAPTGSLTLSDLAVTGGEGSQGAGIYNEGELNLLRTAISNNHALANGGGIFSSGTLLVAYSTFSGNKAGKLGGGVFNDGAFDLYYSTLSNNEATLAHGGAIFNNSNKETNLINSTLSGNRAGGHGGGIYTGINSTVEAYNVTIAFNKANQQDNSSDGGGAYNFGGTFTMRDTLIANNKKKAGFLTVDDDCGGTFKASYNSMVKSHASCTFDDPNNYILTGLDPDLAPLAFNGGWTRTHSFSTVTAAIDSGEAGVCRGPGGQAMLYDQRGYTRVADGNNSGSANCDMGALEYGAGDPCTEKPAAPLPYYPADGAQKKARVWLLEWSPSDCAMLYKVTIRMDGKKGALVQTQDELGGTYLITAKLPRHHTYFWKVRGCNSHGCGKGKTRSFIVQ